ncbi:MAG: hypothetical protein M3N39_03075 [Pseudomonadota bacterium]|nr:hypothetical protein [Pseudomonadota bacterium]
MPRYYFNVYDDAVTEDEEGRELPDLAAVRRAAIEGARSLIADQVLKGRLCLRCRIEVEDENRCPVLTLPFTAALEVVT